MGAYWLNYNSWHNLRHHGLRLGAKVIWQDWQVTGNGFLRISKAKQGKPAQIKHSYFGTGVFGSEVLVNGLDLILERTFSPLEVQMLAYHYPQDANQNPQLLTTGAGVQIRAHPDTLTKNVVLVLEAKHDQAKRWLYMIGLRTRHATHHHIGKTDTDANNLKKPMARRVEEPAVRPDKRAGEHRGK